VHCHPSRALPIKKEVGQGQVEMAKHFPNFSFIEGLFFLYSLFAWML
jgi:hypothetical protein